MITADGAARFPSCPTFGFVAEPGFLVKITPREGGFERRQRVWSQSLTQYTTVPSGDRAQADIEAIYNHWMAVGGMSYAFRFKDWMDFNSCGLDFTPDATDQPIVLYGGDSPSVFRLAKQYVSGPFTQLRYIQRPIGSTVSIANESGVLQTSDKWTLDEATGIVTPGGTFDGTPSHWGGEFDVWVRFNAQLNPTISNYKIQNVSVALTELRQKL